VILMLGKEFGELARTGKIFRLSGLVTCRLRGGDKAKGIAEYLIGKLKA
jgi:hypothetical protein